MASMCGMQVKTFDGQPAVIGWGELRVATNSNTSSHIKMGEHPSACAASVKLKINKVD